ncbi:MAG: hypothetical protein BWY30_00421 [Tenericutes bacterium ADurb.Bin239]|nr:MAG: hypothetical protein BWY30_00421 [Tenericutes bacterium ADurb.Bin239]
MKKAEKIIALIASIFLAVGLVVFVVAMAITGFDFKALSMARYEMKTHEVSENYTNINIDVQIPNITFVRKEGTNTKIETYENKQIEYTVQVANDTLSVSVNHRRSAFFFGFYNVWNTDLTLYVPLATYDSLIVKNQIGTVTIPDAVSFETIRVELATGHINVEGTTKTLDLKAETGNITLNNVVAESVNLKGETGRHSLTNVFASENIDVESNTGKVNFKNVRARNVTIDSETGRLTLDDTVATTKLKVETNTGNIDFIKSDAQDIYAKTEVGNIEGSLLTGKIFVARSNVGRINVPPNTPGAGLCELTTDVGNINITIAAS